MTRNRSTPRSDKGMRCTRCNTITPLSPSPPSSRLTSSRCPCWLHSRRCIRFRPLSLSVYCASLASCAVGRCRSGVWSASDAVQASDVRSQPLASRSPLRSALWPSRCAAAAGASSSLILSSADCLSIYISSIHSTIRKLLQPANVICACSRWRSRSIHYRLRTIFGARALGAIARADVDTEPDAVHLKQLKHSRA